MKGQIDPGALCSRCLSGWYLSQNSISTPGIRNASSLSHANVSLFSGVVAAIRLWHCIFFFEEPGLRVWAGICLSAWSAYTRSTIQQNEPAQPHVLTFRFSLMVQYLQRSTEKGKPISSPNLQPSRWISNIPKIDLAKLRVSSCMLPFRASG